MTILLSNSFVFIDKMGHIVPSYVLDLSGKLVIRTPDSGIDQQIPYAQCAVKSNRMFGASLDAFSIDYLEYLVKLLSRNPLFSNKGISEAYPDSKISIVDGFFIDNPPSADFNLIREAITKYDNNFFSGNFEISSQIENALNRSGVYRIPEEPFNPKFHNNLPNINSIEPGPGWMTKQKVLRKGFALQSE